MTLARIIYWRWRLWLARQLVELADRIAASCEGRPLTQRSQAFEPGFEVASGWDY
jgi:hypothetical protein